VGPINHPAQETCLSFPFSVRQGPMGWNTLYSKRVQLEERKGNSEAWKRGQYMVEVLGQCGVCHAPRSSIVAL